MKKISNILLRYLAQLARLIHRLLRWFNRQVIGIIVLLVVFIAVSWYLIQRPYTQSFLVEKATEYLRHHLDTEVHIEKVYIDLSRQIVLDGIYIEDQQCDTLLYAHQLKVDISQLALLNKEVFIEGISLDHAYLNLYRLPQTNGYNFDFMLQAFQKQPASNQMIPKDTSIASKPTAPSTFNNILDRLPENNRISEFQRQPWQLDLDFIHLYNTQVQWKDESQALETELCVTALETDIEQLDIVKQQLDIAAIRLQNVDFSWNKGLAPTPIPQQTTVLDTNTVASPPSAKNEGSSNWAITLEQFQLDDAQLQYKDAASAIQLTASLDLLDIVAQQFDAEKQIVELTHVHLLEPHIFIQKGRLPIVLPPVPTPVFNKAPMAVPNNAPNPWQLGIQEVNIQDIDFSLADVDKQEKLHTQLQSLNTTVQIPSVDFGQQYLTGTLPKLALNQLLFEHQQQKTQQQTKVALQSLATELQLPLLNWRQQRLRGNLPNLTLADLSVQLSEQKVKQTNISLQTLQSSLDLTQLDWGKQYLEGALPQLNLTELAINLSNSLTQKQTHVQLADLSTALQLPKLDWQQQQLIATVSPLNLTELVVDLTDSLTQKQTHIQLADLSTALQLPKLDWQQQQLVATVEPTQLQQLQLKVQNGTENSLQASITDFMFQAALPQLDWGKQTTELQLDNIQVKQIDFWQQQQEQETKIQALALEGAAHLPSLDWGQQQLHLADGNITLTQLNTTLQQAKQNLNHHLDQLQVSLSAQELDWNKQQLTNALANIDLQNIDFTLQTADQTQNIRAKVSGLHINPNIKSLNWAERLQLQSALPDISLNDVQFILDKPQAPEHLAIQLNTLRTHIPYLDWAKQAIEVDSILVQSPVIVYEKGSPPTPPFLISSPPKADLTTNDEKNQQKAATEKRAIDQAIPWAVDLNTIQLNDLDFVFDDKGALKKWSVALKQLGIDVQNLQLPQQTINLQNIALNELKVEHDMGIDPRIHPDEPIDFEEVIHLNTTNWVINSENININDGYFALRDEQDLSLTDGKINFKNLGVSDIQAQLTDVTFGYDTISGYARQLSAQEQSGFVLNQLKANVLVTPHLAELRQLQLQTPYSQLGDYFALHYTSFWGFKDFVPQVKLDARFQPNSSFTFRDINFFAQKLEEAPIIRDHLDAPIRITGQVKNSINRIKGTNLGLQIANNRFLGDVRIKGLPDFASSSIQAQVKNLSTSIPDLRALIKDLKLPEQFDRLGDLRFSGNFLGFPSDFVADGELITDLGTVTTDLNMEISDPPKYSGELTVQDFDLGKWLNQPDLFGKVSFISNVDGQGFKLDDLKVKVDGTIKEAFVNNYNYTNIGVNGQIERLLFTGLIQAADDHLQLNFEGKVDLNEEIPTYRFVADVEKAHLQQLNVLNYDKIPEDVIVKGNTEWNFSGTEIDNIIGDIKLSDFQLIRGEDSLQIQSFHLDSHFDLNQRSLAISSDILDADFLGTFNFRELPDAAKNYLHTYFPYRFGAADTITSPQQIGFTATIKDVSPLIQLFVPEIQVLKDGYVEGYFNTNTKEMGLIATIDNFTHKDIGVKSLEIGANSNAKRIEFNSQTDSLSIKNNRLPKVRLGGVVFNDSIDFDLKLATDTAATRLHINGLLFANTDTLTLQFDTTEIVINQKEWRTNTGKFIYKNKDYFQIDDIILSQDAQAIRLKSASFPDGNRPFKNKTEIDVENLIIEDWQEVKAIRNLELAGIVNGIVSIEDVFEQQKIVANLEVDSLTFKQQFIGNAKVVARKKKEDNHIGLNVVVDNENYKVSTVQEGYVYLKQADRDTEILELHLKVERIAVQFVEAFLGEVISGTKGFATGSLHIHGDASQPNFDGALLVRNATTTVDYLKTTYRLHNQKIKFNKKTVSFEDIQLQDKHDNEATINGHLYLNDFKNLSLDIRGQTNNFLFLDTKLADNELFYGTAYGNGLVTFRGPVDALKMYVQAKSMPGTTISMPISYDTDVSENNLYTFINTGVVKDSSLLGDSGGSLDMEFDFELTPDAELQVIFDEQAGDIIRGRGSGDIFMQVYTIGEEVFNVYGKYNILKGSYLFTLQNLVNKFFDVQPGGTVSFAGDPYQAILDVDAVYNLKASRSDFLTEDEKAILSRQGQQAIKKRVPVDVNLALTGSLSKPNVEFDLKFPEDGATNPQVDNLMQAKLNELTTNNENELNKQVFGLLVLNRFLAPQTLDITDIRSGVNTTVSEFLSNQLSGYLSEVVAGIIPDSDFNVNWRNYATDGDLEQSSQFRNEIELVFTKRLFNDKLSIDIGGNFDVGDRVDQAGGGNVVFAGDFVIEYLITPDGRQKLRFFNRYDDDLFIGDYTKTGISYTISQEFDSFKEFVELFKNRRIERKVKRAERQQKRKQEEKLDVEGTTFFNRKKEKEEKAED